MYVLSTGCGSGEGFLPLLGGTCGGKSKESFTGAATTLLSGEGTTCGTISGPPPAAPAAIAAARLGTGGGGTGCALLLAKGLAEGERLVVLEPPALPSLLSKSSTM